jgi:cyclase
MLRSRVIPCLLVHNKGLVKSDKFANYKYVGDPINAVKIFNEKEVDELVVLDIDATREQREPDYGMIEMLANECRMPLCYGGGVKSVEQAQRIIKLGVEKVALSSAVLNDMSLIDKMSKVVGRQSVVVILDVKKSLFGRYEIYIENGTKKIKRSFEELLTELEGVGIGELVINSIDRDGTLKGYDLDLAEKARSLISCPLTILGGASSSDDIINLVQKFRVIGAAAGSLFVFKGRYKAVLINYLDRVIRERIRTIAHGK